MSCEALNLFITVAFPFSAAYLPIEFAFRTIVRRTAITGNCSLSTNWFTSLVMLADSPASSVVDCNCKVVLTHGSRTQNWSFGNNNCILIITLLDWNRNSHLLYSRNWNLTYGITRAHTWSGSPVINDWEFNNGSPILMQASWTALFQFLIYFQYFTHCTFLSLLSYWPRRNTRPPSTTGTCIPSCCTTGILFACMCLS